MNIEKLARKSGICLPDDDYPPELERFADLVLEEAAVELVQAIGQYIVMPLVFVAVVYSIVKWF